MKKTLFSICFSLLFHFGYGQTDVEETKMYKNEFGIDVSGIFIYFITYKQSESSDEYLPLYYFTYRRKFKPGNIRTAIGGDYKHINKSSLNPSENNTYFYNAFSINFRLGWEFVKNVGEKSQVYYGVDFRPSFTKKQNEARLLNDNYEVYYDIKNQYYAFAPFLGYRYKLSNRISLTAESSISLVWSISDKSRYSSPSQGLSMASQIYPTYSSVETAISPPLSVSVTFDL